MRLHVVGRERVGPDEGAQPPRAAPFRAGFRPMQQIAFADDADDLSVVVDHRDGADLMSEEGFCNALDGGVRARGDDRGNHDVAGFHCVLHRWRGVVRLSHGTPCTADEVCLAARESRPLT
jgi:hypothetical protein